MDATQTDDVIKRPESPLESALTGLAQVIDRHGSIVAQLNQRLRPLMRDPYPSESVQEVAGFAGDSDLVKTIEINSRNIVEQTEALMETLARLEV